MKKDNNITRWTIEDVRNPNSEFWRYTEDELYDYADGVKPDEVEDFFSATTKLFEQAERYSNKYSSPINYFRKIQEDGIRIMFTGEYLIFSSRNLEALNKIVEYMISKGNRIESQEETIDDFGKRVYSYVIDINDMDSDNMTGLDYD